MKDNKNYRRESKRNEKLTYTLIGIIAVVLMVVIIFVKNNSFFYDEDENQQSTVEQTAVNEQTVEETAVNEQTADETAVGELTAEETDTGNGAVITEGETVDGTEGQKTEGEENSGEAYETVNPVVTEYKFRNKKLLDQHYEKHGIDMGFSSAAEYEAAASAVINNPAALNKIEAEDGDYVYYVEATNEFVILSTDGYIRTYFLPEKGKAYYDKQ